MADVLRTVKLPDGTMRKIKVPEAWGASEIREALVQKGVIADKATSNQSPVSASAEPDDLPPINDPIRRQDTAPDVPSLSERFWRQQGLGVRNVVQGVAGFPTLIGDAANTILNFIPGVELQKPSQMLYNALTDAGLPEPETPGERVAAAATEAVAGAIGGISAAKNIATPFSKMLVEKAGMQVTAATAGGTALGVARENNVGPLGQLAIGVVSAIVGGAGHGVVSTKLAQRLDQRLVLRDKPVTKAEVETMLAEDGVKLSKDSVEARELAEQLDELRVQGKIEEEVRSLQVKKTDTVEQARYKRRELEKLGQTTQPSVEVVRERARIRARQVAEVEAKIREVENRVAQAKPAVRKAKEIAVNSVDQAESAVDRALAITTDPSVPRVTSGAQIGRLRKRDAFGNAVIDRIQKLSPNIAIAVRRVTQRSATRANDDILDIMKFYDSPQYHRLPKADKLELDRAFLNGADDEARAIMARVDGLNELYHQNVRGKLYAMQKDRVAKGADGFIEYFHPRVVKNVAGLRKVAKRNNTAGALDQALADAERNSRKQRGHGLDEREVAALINQYIGGRPLKVLKERRINEITPEMQRYYESSRNSLIDYVRKYHSDDATREFFKNSLGKEIDFGKNAVNDVTVGELLAKSLAETGGLKPTELGEMAELLAAHFGVGRQGPGGFQRTFKNLFTAATLGFNPVSTVTQFGDIAPVMSKFGVLNTLKAANPLRSRASDVTVYDIGVRELSKDMRTVHGTAKVVRTALKAAGFDKLDTIMAGTGVRAALGKWTKLAKTERSKTIAELEPYFGRADAEKMVSDLQAGRMTDDVKTWLLHEVGNIRPISREDMPLHWNQHPNGRWMYSLMSWTLKQMNYVRNSAQQQWRNGKKLSAVKTLGGLAILMGLTNGSVGVMKDFMLGRDIDPASDFVTGMLALGMSGKYAVDALQSNRGLQALGSIIPALGITADAIQKTFSGVMDADIAKLLEATPSGRNLVNLMAGPILPAAAGAIGMAVKSMQSEEKPVPRDTPAQPKPVQEKPVSTNNVQPAKANAPKERGPMAETRDLLVKREGVRTESYKDSLGKLTGGIGHLLTDEEAKRYPEGTAIPQEVVDRWFKRDHAEAFAKASKQAKEVGRPELAKALTSVVFQLGPKWNLPRKEGGKGFVKTWALMKAGKFKEAADEVANSQWASQTPVRVEDFQAELRKL